MYLASAAEAIDEPMLLAAVESLHGNANWFDNIQVEWSEARIVNGQPSTASHQFWSRDGLYFRMDSSTTGGQSKSAKLDREMLIVSPEGFAKRTAYGSDGLVTTESGTDSEGPERLESNPLFKSSLRGLSAYADQALEVFLKSNSPYNVLETVKEGDVVKIRVQIPGGTNESYQYVYEVDTKRGVCVAWTEERILEGKTRSTFRIKKQYASDSSDLIPIAIVSNWKNDSETGESSFTRQSFSKEAADMTYFALDAQSDPSVRSWGLMLTILLVLATLLGAYFAHRRIRKFA